MFDLLSSFLTRARSIFYDNTTSGLVASNVNSAIDELAVAGGNQPFTTLADPALDSITTSMVDTKGGVVITLTGAGNDQTMPTPTDTSIAHKFTIINNDTSTNNIDIIGTVTVTLQPGENVEFIYDGTAWIASESEGLWLDDGTDISKQQPSRNINIGTGALKDNDVTVAIALGDGSNTSFDTTNKTIVGAVNETLGLLPNAIEDVFTPTLGQTVFTLSNTPVGAPSFSLYLNGQLRLRATDYTQSGTTLTWLDPGGLTLTTLDELIARYNNTASSAPVVSVFGRIGDVVAAVDDYNASQVNNDSGVAGATVAAALDTLDAASAPVTSVFGRTGDVIAAVNDYNASQVNNDSGVPGATVAVALDFTCTKEKVIPKTFGDSPYTAAIGEVVFVDTTGGNVIVILPASSASEDGRIRVHKHSFDTNIVTINTTGGDTIGGQSSWTLSHQGDGTTAIADGVTAWGLITERHASGFLYFLPDHDANLGNHRVQNIGATANANFEFRLPDDFDSIISLDLELVPTAAGSAGAGKDIDLTSDYGANGELFNVHTESDVSSTYDTGTQDTFTSIDISGVFTNVLANDVCGLNVDHNSVGGTIAYFGIALTYRKKG